MRPLLSNFINWLKRIAIATPRENFYLLTCRLIDRIEAAESFEELDEATREFHEAYRAYSTHEDWRDGCNTILEAIATKTNDLHTINFS